MAPLSIPCHDLSCDYAFSSAAFMTSTQPSLTIYGIPHPTESILSLLTTAVPDPINLTSPKAPHARTVRIDTKTLIPIIAIMIELLVVCLVLCAVYRYRARLASSLLRTNTSDARATTPTAPPSSRNVSSSSSNASSSDKKGSNSPDSGRRQSLGQIANEFPDPTPLSPTILAYARSIIEKIRQEREEAAETAASMCTGAAAGSSNPGHSKASTASRRRRYQVYGQTSWTDVEEKATTVPSTPRGRPSEMEEIYDRMVNVPILQVTEPSPKLTVVSPVFEFVDSPQEIIEEYTTWNIQRLTPVPMEQFLPAL